jgi:hypothetical protein
MKPILNTIMIATMAVAAFGADQKLNFHVEFPFAVGKVVMPSGQYSVQRVNAMSNHLLITNVSGGAAIVALPVPTDLKSDDSTPRIEFACGSEGCSVVRVANLRAGVSYQAFASKTQGAKLIAVRLTPTLTKAD